MKWALSLLMTMFLLLPVGGREKISVPSEGEGRCGGIRAAQDPTRWGLPRGRWSLSISPTSLPGSETFPVTVLSVTSDARRGLGVIRIQLRNRSRKVVTAVRITWDLVKLHDPETILLSGRSMLIPLPAPLSPRGEMTLEQFIVAFAEISKPLIEPGSDTLTGDYIMHVGVGEVLYEDGSRWAREEPSKSAPSVRTQQRPLSDSGCPNQRCFWDPAYVSYTCRTSEGFGCTIPVRDGSQCTEWICRAPPEEIP